MESMFWHCHTRAESVMVQAKTIEDAVAQARAVGVEPTSVHCISADDDRDGVFHPKPWVILGAVYSWDEVLMSSCANVEEDPEPLRLPGGKA